MELQGALVFQNKNCRNCHALEGSGGTRGPDLTAASAARRPTGQAAATTRPNPLALAA